MAVEEVRGIVLFKKPYRERDFLVKVLTAEYGTVMFFVRGDKRNRGVIYQAIQPFAEAIYIADIRHRGLSFIQGAKGLNSRSSLKTDIRINAYASHMLALSQAASREFDPNLQLYHELKWTLDYMDQDLDAEALCLIFEVKALRHFGVLPHLDACVICGEGQGVFDYSMQHNGLLCVNHFHLNPKRLHASPRAIHLIRQFVQINYPKLTSIDLKKETKQEIAYVIDHIYEESVGIHLKTKKYIKQMDSWAADLQAKIKEIKDMRNH